MSTLPINAPSKPTLIRAGNANHATLLYFPEQEGSSPSLRVPFLSLLGCAFVSAVLWAGAIFAVRALWGFPH